VTDIAHVELRQRFTDVFDRTPGGIWAAPGRVNLIGEHVDYNGGLVLPFAIEQRTYAATAARDDDVLRVRSMQLDGGLDTSIADLAPERAAAGATSWASYVAGVLWVLREDGHDVSGMDLLLDGRVPVGAGLSSSAALECSAAIAANDLCELSLSKAALARVAQRAENDYVGVPCGLMDQMASMACTTGHALLFDVRSEEIEQVPFDPAAEGLRVLIMDTRVKHSVGEGAYAQRRRSTEDAATALGVSTLREVPVGDLDDALAKLDCEVVPRVRHVVAEIARVQQAVEALRKPDWTSFGRLMTASHLSLRDDYEVSSEELDVAVDAALAAGALGARMTGAGFGGSAIALIQADQVGAVSAAVEDAFAARGFAEPATLSATASDGASRVA
jgi:galactokinase